KGIFRKDPLLQIILFSIIDLSTYYLLSLFSFESFVFLILVIAQLSFCLIFGTFRKFNHNLNLNLNSLLETEILSKGNYIKIQSVLPRNLKNKIKKYLKKKIQRKIQKLQLWQLWQLYQL
ncbi:MAG: hypothetical protein ACTSU2_15230, partial [Promethearchaeota archaeon]